MDPLNSFLSQVATNSSSKDSSPWIHKFNHKIPFWLAIILGQAFVFVLLSVEDLGLTVWILSGTLALISTALLGLSLLVKNSKTVSILLTLSILLVTLIYFINGIFLKQKIFTNQSSFEENFKSTLPSLKPNEIIAILPTRFGAVEDQMTQLNTYRTCFSVFLSLTYFSIQKYNLLSTAALLVITSATVPFVVAELTNWEVMIGQTLVFASVIFCFSVVKLQKDALLEDFKLKNQNLENVTTFFKDWLKNLNCNYILVKNGAITFENLKTIKTKAENSSFYSNTVVSASSNELVKKGQSLGELIAKADKIDTEGRITKICEMKATGEQPELHFECHLKQYKEGFVELYVVDITATVQRGQQEIENKLKKMAFAQAVHEFKTPLNTIVLLVNELTQISPEMPTHQANSKLEILKGLSSYITYLIADIHCYCGNNEMKNNLAKEVSLNEVFNFCFSILQALVKAKGQGRVEVIGDNTLEGRNMTMMLDGERLKQVILNAISNSVKFTKKGFIWLTCRQEINSDLVVFEVEDSGKGIDELTMSKIKKNTTAFSVRNLENANGTGLGIQICKRICKVCGFEFNLQSKEKKGTKVSIGLDKNKFLAEECLSVNSTVLWKEGMCLPTEGFSPKQEKCVINTQIQLIHNNISFGVKDQIIEGETVILIDDMSVVRNSTKAMLTKISKEFGKSWNFIDACDGAEAIFHVIRCSRDKIPISFIISDECMDYVDGSQTVSLLRDLMESGKINTFSCFSYTSMNGEEPDEQFDAVIDKPVSREMLSKILQENNII